MKKIRFTKSDLEKIEQTVKKAEGKTSGEIATVYIKESYDYAKYELLFGIMGGFIYFFLAVFYFDQVENIFKTMFWDYSINYTLTFLGSSTFIIIFLSYLFGNIKFINRRIIPKSIKKKMVKERALRYFTESGIYHTKYRTGILLFISDFEQQVVLLADTGINKKIPQKKWDGIVNNIIKGIKTKNTVKALCESIEECGDLLSVHFPSENGNSNELQNSLSILEK